MDANQKTVFQEISRVRRNWTPAETISYISALPIWEGEVSVEQKFGGMRNRMFFVTRKDGRKYAVRVGFDDSRTRQTTVVQCAIAAHMLGVGPRLVYAEPNLTITDFIEGKAMQAEQMTDPAIMKQIIDRMKILHNGGHAIQETISFCWPFDSVRRFLNTLEDRKSTRLNSSHSDRSRMPSSA